MLSQGLAPNDVARSLLADDAGRDHRQFHLVDAEGKAVVTLRREELILRGCGHISFGHAFADDPAEVLAFACLE